MKMYKKFEPIARYKTMGTWLKDENENVFMLNKQELALNDDMLLNLLINDCQFTKAEALQIIQEVRS
jgi:hypothetical protein